MKMEMGFSGVLNLFVTLTVGLGQGVGEELISNTQKLGFTFFSGIIDEVTYHTSL
jgi:hypothetical protein